MIKEQPEKKAKKNSPKQAVKGKTKKQALFMKKRKMQQWYKLSKVKEQNEAKPNDVKDSAAKPNALDNKANTNDNLDSEAKAKKHRNAYRLGAKKNRLAGKCPCCDQYQVAEDHPLCCPPFCSTFPQPQLSLTSSQQTQSKDGKIPHMYLYFTFLKGLILFLALRFLCFDLMTMYQSIYGSYCSELFRTKGEVCTYTLSPYNLKGETQSLNNDQLNAVFTLLSIIYFSRLKTVILSGKKVYQAGNMDQDTFSLLVSNIPNLTYQHSEYNEMYFGLQDQIRKDINNFLDLSKVSQLIAKKCKTFQCKEQTLKNSGQNCSAQIRRVFLQQAKKAFSQKSGLNLINQQYYLKKNAEKSHLTKNKQQIIKISKLFQQGIYHWEHFKKEAIVQQLDRIRQSQQRGKIRQYMLSKIGNLSLLDYITINLVTGITLCYDINELNTINNIRNNVQSFTNQREINDDQKQEFILDIVYKCNNLELDLSQQFDEPLRQKFHTSHFLGKAIVSFEFQIFRDLLLQSYEADPNSFKINGNTIIVEAAPKSSDIIWQNMSQHQQIKKKYNQHSWIVMIMMLVLSFAAFTGLQLFSTRFQVVHAEETPWQKFKRLSISLLSALVTSLINMFLAYQINMLVEMEKHVTRIARQRSLIVKSILAQSFNTIAIYIIIYLVHPTNPLGQYGLAEKAISLAIMSNLTTFILQVIRPASLWGDIQNISVFSANNKQKKFQIKLNKEYEYPKFDQQAMYVSYTLMLFLVSFYGYLVPVTTPIVLGSFIILYWVDKYNAFKRSSLDSFDDNKGDLILGIIQISVLISAVSYFLWDLSLQKVSILKPLNLASIFLAAQFIGFQVLNSKQLIDRILDDEQKEAKCKKSYYDMLTKFGDKTYENQSLATKHYSFSKFQKEQNGSLQNNNQLKTGGIVQMVKKYNKFQNLIFSDKSNQGANVTCSICEKLVNQKDIIQNISCNHNACLSCFWNNIYYQAETFSKIDCIYCNSPINQTLYVSQLQQSTQDRIADYLQKIYLRKQKEQKKQMLPCLSCCRRKNLYYSEPEYYHKESGKCQICKTEYCDTCLFQKHEGKECQKAYEQRTCWRKCKQCNLMVQPTWCCSHVFMSQPQDGCLICIFGWSNRQFHCCKTIKYDAKSLRYRHILNRSCFIKFGNGAIYMIAFLCMHSPILFYLVLDVIILAVAICVSPLVVVYLVVRRLIFNCQWIIILQLTIFLPFTAVAYLKEVMSASLSSERIRKFRQEFPLELIVVKDTLYEYQPYKQNASDYTHMKISGTKKKLKYFFLMLALIPILFPLAIGYLVVSALYVLCFTLIFLPFIISYEKRVSIWLPIIFYPVMLIYYVFPLYFGSFIRRQLTDVVTFYFHYTKTMFGYLFCSCRDNENEESTSVYDENEKKDGSK